MSANITKIAVLGGGISGLSQAYYLQKMMKNCNVKIFEASNNVSGAMQTKNDEGFYFEQGPRSIRNGNTVFEVLKICEDINILDKIIPSENFDNAFVYYDGQLRQLPRKMSPGPLMSFVGDHPKLLQSAFKIKYGRQKSDSGDCNMEQFVMNKLRFAGFQFSGLSEFINTYLLNSFAKGVYRAEASDLSTELCLQKKHIRNYIHDFIDPSEFKQPKYSDNLKQFIESKIKKSGSINFENGIQTFPNELAKYLQNKTQTQIQLNSEVNSMTFKNQKILVRYLKNKVQSNGSNQDEEFDYVISTLNSPQINKILNNSNGNQQRAKLIKYQFKQTMNLQNNFINLQIIYSILFSQNKSVIIQNASLNTKYKLIKNRSQFNQIASYGICQSWVQQGISTFKRNNQALFISNQLQSFGYLIPTVADQHLIGVVFDSFSYPTLGPKNSTRISLMYGNKLDINSPKEEFIKVGLKELAEQAGITEKPDKINFYKWEPSFPEYSVNHYYKSLRMLETSKHIHPNFQLHGRFLFTAAIPELILLSKCFAKQISSR